MPVNWKPEGLKQKRGTAEGEVNIRGGVADGGERKKKRRRKNKS